MKRINTQVLAAAVGISLCGGLLADAFPLTPAEATNPLVIDISDETTLADYLLTSQGGGVYLITTRSSSAARERLSSTRQSATSPEQSWSRQGRFRLA